MRAARAHNLSTHPPLGELGCGPLLTALRVHRAACGGQASDSAWFEKDPPLAWGLNYHQLNVYRRAAPHEGYRVMQRLARLKSADHYFCWTSNVDGVLQRVFGSHQRINEVNGSVWRSTAPFVERPGAPARRRCAHVACLLPRMPRRCTATFTASSARVACAAVTRPASRPTRGKRRCSWRSRLPFGVSARTRCRCPRVTRAAASRGPIFGSAPSKHHRC